MLPARLSTVAPFRGQGPGMNITFSASLEAGSVPLPAPYAPVLALIAYANRPGALHDLHLLSHAVHDTASGYVLGAGTPLGDEGVRKLVAMFAGSGMTWAAPDTLATSPTATCWWIPPGARTLRFDPKYTALASIATLSGTPVPHPGLVLFARPGQLQVFAVAGNGRPGRNTSLFHAPFWNMFSGGAMCQGSVRYPETATPDTQVAWEEALFGSMFTGPSRQDRYMNWPEGYEALLRHALGLGHFPGEVLVCAGRTLGELLSLKGRGG